MMVTIIFKLQLTLHLQVIQIVYKQLQSYQMNQRQNNYPQAFQDVNRNSNVNSAGPKFLPSKNRKWGVPIQKERLYQENYQLRNRLKELEETNLRLRTQLAVAEREKDDLFSMAEEEVFNPKAPQRSQSGAHKMSVGHSEAKNNFTLLKQKQNSAFKKLVRDKHNQNQKLRQQNQNIKKTMKFTRLNQLITENNQLLEETRRLKIQIIEARSASDQIATDYSIKIDSLKRQLQHQRESEKRNGVELKRQLETMGDLKQKLRDIELKKVEVQKRLNKEIKSLRAENIELRSRVIGQASNKECEKTECSKNRRQKHELKKKNEQQQKQIKILREQIMIEKRNLLDKEMQLKFAIQSAKKQQIQPTNSDKKQSHQLNSVNRKEDLNNVNHKNDHESIQKVQKNTAKLNPMQNLKQDYDKHHSNQNQFKQEKKKNQKNEKKQSQDVKIAELKEDKNKEVNKNVPKIKDHQLQLSEKKKSQNERKKSEVKEVPLNKKSQISQQKSHKKQEYQDSYDTERLLESEEQNKPTQAKIEKSVDQTTKINKQLTEQEKYKESDGDYEQIQFDDQQYKQPVTTKKKQEKKDKPSQKKKEDSKAKSKNKKSTKKMQQKEDSQEQILYKNEDKKKQDDGQKAQLKLIRETLTYKFMAQGYTYEQFNNYIKEANKKDFSVTEIMNILGQEPFLLADDSVDAVIIYLFETDNLTGDEVIATKAFSKKMKKFLAKAKPIDEEIQRQNINHLISIIQKDEKGKKKIRHLCEKQDDGNGTITKATFVGILNQLKIQKSLHETAISQIVYISSDVNHLNYDFFLKRFTQAE